MGELILRCESCGTEFYGSESDLTDGICPECGSDGLKSMGELWVEYYRAKEGEGPPLAEAKQ